MSEKTKKELRHLREAVKFKSEGPFYLKNEVEFAVKKQLPLVKHRIDTGEMTVKLINTEDGSSSNELITDLLTEEEAGKHAEKFREQLKGQGGTCVLASAAPISKNKLDQLKRTSAIESYIKKCADGAYDVDISKKYYKKKEINTYIAYELKEELPEKYAVKSVNVSLSLDRHPRLEGNFNIRDLIPEDEIEDYLFKKQETETKKASEIIKNNK